MSAAALDVLHVVPGLGMGGAERMLATLVSAPRDRPLGQRVVALGEGGPNEAAIRDAGVPVDLLGLRSISGLWGAIRGLARLIRATRPRAVQGWMYYGDLAALWALQRSGRRAETRLYWGLRCSDMDLARYRARLRCAVRLAARASARPEAVIANSFAGLAVHCRLGYAPRAAAVIPNGIDTARFRPDPARRAETRRALALSPDARVVAHIARVDPMKDHASLARVAASRPGLVFLAIGKGTESLAGPENLRRLGLRADVPALLAASDAFLSTSAFGEGFSNVIGEAMAAGLPAVATDVGDARRIVGALGHVVPPRDPEAAAAALDAVFALGAEARAALGAAARARIEAEFSVARMVAAFDALHRDGIVPPCAASSG